MKALLAFLEAFFTVWTAGLSPVMLTAGTMYTWPSAPAAFLITVLALLAGIRRMQSLYALAPDSAR